MGAERLNIMCHSEMPSWSWQERLEPSPWDCFLRLPLFIWTKNSMLRVRKRWMWQDFIKSSQRDCYHSKCIVLYQATSVVCFTCKSEVDSLTFSVVIIATTPSQLIQLVFMQNVRGTFALLQTMNINWQNVLWNYSFAHFFEFQSLVIYKVSAI